MSRGYGKRGGISATSGRKAETIVACIGGMKFSKRVFFGQRWLVVSQRDEADKQLITAWSTREEAEAKSEEARRSGCVVHFAIEAQCAA